MKVLKRIVAVLFAITFFPTFQGISFAEETNVANGKSLEYSNGGYILDLERAYPVKNIEISGVDTSSAKVMMSNDPEFAKPSSNGFTNIATGKPILSKLYGEGGYTADFSVKNAVDGNGATQFISTPGKDSVEWLTIDLQYPALINYIDLNFSANRTYTVSVTNTPHEQTEEFTDGLELIETSSKYFVLPEVYKDSAYRYVRLRFDGDAPSDYYLDVNMYVYEITINGKSATNLDTQYLTTTTLVKDGSVFRLSDAAKDNYYRYIKVSGVSGIPTVEVNAKNGFADCIDVTADATVTISEGAVIFGSFVVDRVKDGNYSTFTAFSHHTPYVQLDLHKERAISHVEVYCRRDMLSDRDGIKILLSNSPDFNDYVILGEQASDEEIGLKAAFVRGRSNILDYYRYIRVYAGESSAFLVLSEIRVFAKEGLDDMYNVAENVEPTADINGKLAYRATDRDVKSWWSGNSLTINLDRCYSVLALNITATGNLKITYGCSNGDTKTYSDSFADKETINTFFDENINTVTIETIDSKPIDVYNVGVYAKKKNAYITAIAPMSVTSFTPDYNMIDLGRLVIIDHIEPCNITVDISETEDFEEYVTVTGCKDSKVSGRYICVPKGTNIDIIGYESPELVNRKEGKSVEFRPELYDNGKNAIAFAAVYENDDALAMVKVDDASSGSLKLKFGDKASFMVWDGMSTLKPLLPKSETVYVNKIPQAEFYVDPDASASGDGTKASPFKTIQEAQSAVRAINSSMTGDIVVNLRGGKYYLDDTLKFNNLDGGTNGYRVIYKNVEGETPVVSGGKRITRFTEGENGIWYADASDFDSIYELIVNGEVATLARTEVPIHADCFYNNGTEYEYDGISFNKADLPMISNPEDAFVHVTRSWMDVLLKVTGASEDDEHINLDISQPKFKNVTEAGAMSGHEVVPGANFYIENAIELLDTPGEFYFDKDTKILYYMPRNSEDKNTAVVDGAVLEELVVIRGTSKYDHVENITFSGIRFENSTLKRMYKYGFKTAQAQVITFDTPEFLDGAIQIDYATNIEISGCEVTGLTKPAISMHNGVVNSKISNNFIHNVGDSAIVVGSQFHHVISGANELTQRVTVSDNIVKNTGLKHRGAPGIACYYVTDVDIVHNKIADCSYSGISLGWGWSNYPNSTTCRRNTVANNYIENTNLLATDGGAIYTLGNQPGTVIEGNYIVQTKKPEQKTGFSAIYPDEGSAYMIIRNNVVDAYNIKDYADNVRDISLWNPSINNILVHDNFSTYINVRNNGTDCVVDTPELYVEGAEPEAAQRIMSSSAREIKFK